jgi:hypothetical protein
MNINTITASDLMMIPKYSRPYMITQEIGFSRSGDNFCMFDLTLWHENETILSVSCSTPERLLAHLKGYVANRLEVAA